MAEPIYPKGYVKPLQDVYAGNLPGKPRGLLPNVNPIGGFFYRHSLNRLGGFGLTVDAGFWTIQFTDKESLDDPNAKIFFEQSVEIGVDQIGPVWLIPSEYQYKFKTRICNAEFVPPVIEAIAPKGQPGTDTTPATPGPPHLFNVRLTRLSVAMPSLPARAASCNLLYAKSAGAQVAPADADFKLYKAGLGSGEVVNIDVAGLGITSENVNTAPTDLIWVRVQAVAGTATTLGPAVRDVWTHQNGNALDAGYQGYLYGDTEVIPAHDLTAYYEESYTINQSPSGSGFITGDWISPAYKCKLPTGCYMHIISDHWVSQNRNDNIYYALSYRVVSDSVISAVIDQFGGLALATLNTGAVYVRYGPEPYATLQSRALEKGEQPSILVDNRNTFWLNVINEVEQVYEERRSRNGAMSFDRLVDANGVNKGLIYGGIPGMPQGFAIGGGNGNNSNSATNERGVILFEGSNLIFKRSGDSWATAVTIATFGVSEISDYEHQTANPVQPMAGFCAPSGTIYADNGKGLTWRSRDHGATWQRVGTDVT